MARTSLHVALSGEEENEVQRVHREIMRAFPGSKPSRSDALRVMLWRQGEASGRRFVNAAARFEFMDDLGRALEAVEPDDDMRSRILHAVSKACLYAKSA